MTANKKQGRFAGAMKGLGEGIVKGLDAMAEADRRASERSAERIQNELKYRAVVEEALLSYEKHVGVPFSIDPRSTAKVQQPYYNTSGDPMQHQPMVIWSTSQPGHLMQCKTPCYDKHCIVCGDTIYGVRVYCDVHRPRR